LIVKILSRLAKQKKKDFLLKDFFAILFEYCNLQ